MTIKEKSTSSRGRSIRFITTFKLCVEENSQVKNNRMRVVVQTKRGRDKKKPLPEPGSGYDTITASITS